MLNMMPFLMTFVIGKNKNLPKQDLMKAALTSQVTALLPGPAGAMLGTISAVNEIASKNKAAIANAARANAERENSQAHKDLTTLLQTTNIDLTTKKITINIDDDVTQILTRHQLETGASSIADAQTQLVLQMATYFKRENEKAAIAAAPVAAAVAPAKP